MDGIGLDNHPFILNIPFIDEEKFNEILIIIDVEADLVRMPMNLFSSGSDVLPFLILLCEEQSMRPFIGHLLCVCVVSSVSRVCRISVSYGCCVFCVSQSLHLCIMSQSASMQLSINSRSHII